MSYSCTEQVFARFQELLCWMSGCSSRCIVSNGFAYAFLRLCIGPSSSLGSSWLWLSLKGWWCNYSREGSCFILSYYLFWSPSKQLLAQKAESGRVTHNYKSKLAWRGESSTFSSSEREENCRSWAAVPGHVWPVCKLWNFWPKFQCFLLDIMLPSYSTDCWFIHLHSPFI